MRLISMSSVSAMPAAFSPNSSASSPGDISIFTVWEVAVASCSVVPVVLVVFVTSETVAPARSEVADPGCVGSGVITGAGVAGGAGFARRWCWDVC